MPFEKIQPRNAFRTVGYSPVVRCGDTLYISGQVARTPAGELVGTGDGEAQSRQVYRNLQALLEELGGSLDDVVKMTTFLTRREDLEVSRAVRREFFPDPAPAHTLLFVAGLADPHFLIEVEAVAVLGG